MRILDTLNDKSLNKVILYLTKEEAIDLLNDLNDMIGSNEEGNHVHLTDEDYEHEISIAIYDTDNLMSFDDRSVKIINENK